MPRDYEESPKSTLEEDIALLRSEHQSLLASAELDQKANQRALDLLHNKIISLAVNNGLTTEEAMQSLFEKIIGKTPTHE